MGGREKKLCALIVATACTGKQGPAGPPGAGPDAGAVPAGAPQGVTFVDEDPRQGLVTGALTIQHAADESDVTAYAVYWGTDAGAKVDLSPIIELAKTGQDVTYRIPTDTPVPAGATSLLAFAVNAGGESATAAVATAADNYAVVTDLSMGQPAGTFAVVTGNFTDAANSKFNFSAKKAASADFVLFRCAADATQCSSTDLGTNLPTMLDPVRSKMIVNYNRAQGNYAFCELDGTACSAPVNVFTGSGLPATNNRVIATAIDAANQKFLLLASNTSQGLLGVIVANLDGSNPAFVQLEANANLDYVTLGGGLVIDATNAKLLVIRNGDDVNTGAQSTVLYRCNLDATGCTQPWATTPPGAFTQVYGVTLDKTSQTLAFAVTTWDPVATVYKDNRMMLCDAGFASCSSLDPADGLPWIPSGLLRIDTTHSELFVGTYDANVNMFSVVRCDATGHACADMAVPLFGVLDPSHQHMLAAYVDPTSHRLSSYMIRTW
jgi:hypothetical protein